MKRSCTILAALAVLSLLCADPAGAGVSVRITGGMNRVSYGNYNDYVDYANRQMAAETISGGSIESIHWIPEFSGEVLYSFMPTMTIGVGAGMISGTSNFKFGVADNSFSFKHTVKAYPITGTLYVSIPAPFTFAKPYVFGGCGLYYSKVTFNENVTVGGTPAGYDAALTKWGFGVLGGVGLEFAIVAKVACDLGITGRYAKIKGFTGTATSSDGRAENVFLAYSASGGAVVFGPEPTSEKGTYGEGAVDLSGFAASLSVKVSF